MMWSDNYPSVYHLITYFLLAIIFGFIHDVIDLIVLKIIHHKNEILK